MLVVKSYWFLYCYWCWSRWRLCCELQRALSRNDQICNKVNFSVSQSRVATCSKRGEKYYMAFIVDFVLFSAVNEFLKAVKNW